MLSQYETKLRSSIIIIALCGILIWPFLIFFICSFVSTYTLMYTINFG